MLEKFGSYLEPGELFEKILSIYLQNTFINNHENSILDASEIHYINESRLYKSLLPMNLYDSIVKSGVVGIYSLSFLLRHVVTYLSEVLHLLVCPDTARIARVKSMFDFDLDFDMQWCKQILIQPGKGQKIPRWDHFRPLLGFSALGLHLNFVAKESCRAFDYYDLKVCSQKGAPLFCDFHKGEVWHGDYKNCQLRQSVMFAFYAKLSNILEYDQQQLKQMMANFKVAFSSYNSQLTKSEMQDALDFFDINDLNQLKHFGMDGMRKEYSRLVFVCHPDTGGDKKKFVELQKNYKILKKLLI